MCAKNEALSNTPARQVPRDVNEYARDVARRLMRTKAFLKSRDERKRVEMRFAHLKIHHGFNECGSEVSPAPETNSTWQQSCKTSKPWHSELSGRLPYQRRSRELQIGSRQALPPRILIV